MRAMLRKRSWLVLVLPLMLAACEPVKAAGDDDGDGGSDPDGGRDPDANGDHPDGMVDAGGGIDAALKRDVRWLASNGLPDHACAPWTSVDTAQPEDGVIAPEGYLLVTSDPDAETLFYQQTQNLLEAPADGKLVLQARARFIEGRASSSARSGAHLGFVMGGKANTLFFENGNVFLLAAESTRGAERAMTTEVFHNYRIEVDLHASAGTNNISVLQDGAVLISGRTFAAAAGTPDVIYFGDSTQNARATSHWLSVEHNAHVPVACP